MHVWDTAGWPGGTYTVKLVPCDPTGPIFGQPYEINGLAAGNRGCVVLLIVDGLK